MSEYYYKMPIEKRWLPSGSNPSEIGGRSTDIEAIAISLYWAVRDTYPINEVPAKILGDLGILENHLEIGSQMIQDLIDKVSVDLYPEVIIKNEEDQTD